MQRLFISLTLFLICFFKGNGQWIPIFWEDFNGDSLDTKKWIVGYPWGHVNNTNTFMLAKNMKVANGQLTITALHENFDDNGTLRTNTSGAISSNIRFQNGLFAIKFKASSLFWPAFWLYGAEGNEIDFFELGNVCDPVLGICTIDRSKMVHIGTQMGGGNWYDVNKDWNSEWHIIAGNWDGNMVDVYVDGAYITSYMAHYKHDLGIIIDLEVPDKDHAFLHTKVPENSDFPNQMAIDWVRAWTYDRQFKMDTDSLILPIVDIKPDLEIYPNPGNGIFRINLLNVQSQTPYSIEIMDELGRMVFNKVGQVDFDNILDLTNYSSGIYTIGLKINYHNIYKKIIKI